MLPERCKWRSYTRYRFNFRAFSSSNPSHLAFASQNKKNTRIENHTSRRHIMHLIQTENQVKVINSCDFGQFDGKGHWSPKCVPQKAMVTHSSDILALADFRSTEACHWRRRSRRLGRHLTFVHPMKLLSISCKLGLVSTAYVWERDLFKLKMLFEQKANGPCNFSETNSCAAGKWVGLQNSNQRK